MNIFIFHRDLRLKDNKGLIELAKEKEPIYLFFIFSKKQLEKNKYFSSFAFNYMLNCLNELSKKVQINFFLADNELSLIKSINKKIKKIYTNRDYTHFAKNRSLKLADYCQKNNIEYKEFDDYLLFNKNDNSAKVFTFFWQKTITKLKNVKFEFISPKFQALSFKNQYSIDLNKFVINKTPFPHKPSEVILAIKNIDKDYKENRDFLELDASSKISCAIKFGIISIREAITYSLLNQDIENEYTKQIIWREFFYHSYLQSLEYRPSLQNTLLTRFEKFPYINDKNLFDKWSKGETGFEVVDAAMVELNTTGYMHNRARMIAASFLTKNLLIDWRWGEIYFASKLIDYDPIVNNASWQWVAGCGFESNPFYRIFNPYLQEQKFDPNRKYITKWLGNRDPINPIIDYKKSRARALDIFKAYFKK